MCNCSKTDSSKRQLYGPVTNCIFDLDGTLLKSEDVYQEMVKELCAKYGKPYPDKIRHLLYGVPKTKLCEMVINEVNMEVTVPELEDQLTLMALSKLPKAPLQLGALRLVDHLISHRIPIAIATNCSRYELNNYIDARPIFFSKFNHLVSASDVEEDRVKPQPDLYLLAAAMFSNKPSPKSCLVFEDSLCGLQAGVAAGMRVILTPHTGFNSRHSRKATQIIPNLLEFKPELYGLPSFNTPGNSRPDLICLYKNPSYWQ